jgi:hypothetical protein
MTAESARPYHKLELLILGKFGLSDRAGRDIVHFLARFAGYFYVTFNRVDT